MISRIRNILDEAQSLQTNRGLPILLVNAVGTGYEKTLRRLVPKYEYCRMNGVRIGSERRRYHLLDRWVPWPTPWDPNWKASINEYKQNTNVFIQEYVKSGDDVCIIGGGYGVSTIKTSEVVEETGSVTVYEAARERYETLIKTIELNNAHNVDSRHALVGPDVSVSGDFEQATVIETSDLPESDVLELDCEGAELAIIESLSFQPRMILVETHPELGVTTPQVRNALMDSGYKIDDEVDDPISGSILAAKKTI